MIKLTPITHTLRVVFEGGRHHDYDVQPETFQRFRSALQPDVSGSPFFCFHTPTSVVLLNLRRVLFANLLRDPALHRSSGADLGDHLDDNQAVLLSAGCPDPIRFEIGVDAAGSEATGSVAGLLLDFTFEEITTTSHVHVFDADGEDVFIHVDTIQALQFPL